MSKIESKLATHVIKKYFSVFAIGIPWFFQNLGKVNFDTNSIVFVKLLPQNWLTIKVL
jgi:hypothetical protein